MRKIIHVDMDCFYAAVEMRDFPEYQKVPIAVGFDGPRSVLCTCNYLARTFGVRSAMPAIQAKKLCPELKIVSARMAVYKEISNHIRAIFRRYTDKIEPLSLDEAYLDVTNSEHCQGSATLIAEEIRQAIFDELRLTASAGVAPNKFLAKIASDENKPNGLCVVSPDKVEQFVEKLPLKKLPGIGPKTADKLSAHGLITCEDVRLAKFENLVPLLGNNVFSLYQRCFGIDEREVVTDRIRKSLGVEQTFATDLAELAQCQQVITELYQKLTERFSRCETKAIVKQGVKIKFADFSQTTIEQQSNSDDLDTFRHLLVKAFERGNGRKIRLLGLNLGFKTTEPEQVQQLSLNLSAE